MNLPLFSRIRSGKRWFWCVALGLLEDPQFTGFSDTPEAALDDAKKVAGEVDQIGNWKARVALRQRRAEKIRQKESDTQEAHQLEFVYDCWGVDSHHKHRIVKKTKKQIVVEKIPFHWGKKKDGSWRDFDVETFVIPREEFEREGKYWHRRNCWYVSPEVYQREVQERVVPDCFKALGEGANLMLLPIPLPSSTLFLSIEEALSLLESLEAALPHSDHFEIAGEVLSTREMQALLLELKVMLAGGRQWMKGDWRKGF